MKTIVEKTTKTVKVMTDDGIGVLLEVKKVGDKYVKVLDSGREVPASNFEVATYLEEYSKVHPDCPCAN